MPLCAARCLDAQAVVENVEFSGHLGHGKNHAASSQTSAKSLTPFKPGFLPPNSAEELYNKVLIFSSSVLESH